MYFNPNLKECTPYTDAPTFPISIRNLFTPAHLDYLICTDIFNISYTDFVYFVYTKKMSRSKAINKLTKNIPDFNKKLSLFANLKLHTTVKDINSIYSSCDSKSCETGNPVGKFYKYNKIGIVGSSNFRCLVNLKTGKFLDSFYGSFITTAKLTIPKHWLADIDDFVFENNYRFNMSTENIHTFYLAKTQQTIKYKLVTIYYKKISENSDILYSPYCDFNEHCKTKRIFYITKKAYELFNSMSYSCKNQYPLHHLIDNPKYDSKLIFKEDIYE